MIKIKLLHVHFLPTKLESGVLYVSKEFGIAGHLCPCGCGNKIMTPLGPTDWSLAEVKGKPTLYPSIGSWQLPCKSHYWISEGKIKWSYQWSEDQIIEGRINDENRRKLYFENLDKKNKKKSIFSSLLRWLNGR